MSMDWADAIALELPESVYRDVRTRIDAERANARRATEALRQIRGFDDTWAHRGHEPNEAGHECRMCWIMKTVARALAEAGDAPEAK